MYNMPHANGLLPLPSIKTLHRSKKSIRPDLGFDKALFAGLKLELEGFPRKEQRGILMFDEMQVKRMLISELKQVDWLEWLIPVL